MNINDIEQRFDHAYEDDRDLAEWARDHGSDLIEYVFLCREFFKKYKGWALRGNDYLDEKEMIEAINKFDKEIMGD